MSPRASRRDDRVDLRLQTWEVSLLRRLRDGLEATLQDAGSDDPVVDRLFPRAVEDDDEHDDQLRALIGTELLTSRLEGLAQLVAILDRGSEEGGQVHVELVEDEPALVLGVLNDLRVALGARVAIEDLDRDELDEDDPEAATVAVMDHLAFLQEELLTAVDPAALSFYDDLDPGGAAGDEGT